MEFSVLGILAAGFLTFLSPCVLPLAPVYLGILAGSTPGAFNVDPLNSAPRHRMVVSTVLFVVGFTLVFSLLGLSATFVGRLLTIHRELFQQIGGLLIILLGMHFLGWLHLPFLQRSSSGMSRFTTRFHYVNALLMGIAFAFVWSPCIGAVLGSVLTYTSLKTTSPFEGMGLLALYGAGFGAPLIVFSVVADRVMPLFQRSKRFIPVFSRVTGGLMVVAGLLLNTGYMARLDAWVSGDSGSSSTSVISESFDPGVESLGRLIAGLSRAEGADSCDSEAAGSTCAGLEPGPVMMEFFSPGCKICRNMIPVVDALRNDCPDEQVVFKMIDISKPDGRALAARYGVTGIPVFVFEDATGTEQARLVGKQDYRTLQQALSALTGESCDGYRQVDFLKSVQDG